MTFIPSQNEDSKAHGCFGTRIPFDPDMHGDPITKVRSDLGEHRFVWDTGAPLMIVRKSLVSSHGALPVGNVFQSKVFKLGGQDFGPMQLHMLDFGEPAEVDGYIGYDFFARNVVCIDFGGRQFLIRPKPLSR